MSRTYRRQQKFRINQHVKEEESTHCGLEPYVVPRLRHLTDDERIKYHRAWISRDHRSGLFGVPRWYRRKYGTEVVRKKEKQELHRCLVQGDWDDHLPDNRVRDSMYYWWY